MKGESARLKLRHTAPKSLQHWKILDCRNPRAACGFGWKFGCRVLVAHSTKRKTYVLCVQAVCCFK